MLGTRYIKADGGVGGCGREQSDLITFMSYGALEKTDVFTRCSFPFLLDLFKK